MTPIPVRVKPHSTEAEERLLSACLLDGGQSLAVCLEQKVIPSHFYTPASGEVYSVLLDMFSSNKPVDLAVLSEELKKIDKLDSVGGYAYLARLSSAAATTANLSYDITKVKEMAMLRSLIEKGGRIVDRAYSYEGDLATFATEIEDALRLYNTLDKPKTLASACDDTLAKIEDIANGKVAEGYAWPWAGMDERLDQAEGGELIIIAARPGRGKSSAARQIADYWSQKYGDVAFFSREMPVGQLPQLFAQSLCGHSWRDARRGKLHRLDLIDFSDAVRQVKKNTKIHIFDKDSTMAQVLARVRSFRAKTPLKAIVVDYLQAYDVQQQKGETRDVAIGRFTRALKDLALDLGIPVILLAQLSRGVEKEEREPRASDLRESGNIEQDADRIIFSHWNPVTADGIAQDFTDYTKVSIESSFIQVKNRNGTSGKLDVMFHRPTTTFRSILPVNHAS
jgi:replicative DNA helicase